MGPVWPRQINSNEHFGEAVWIRTYFRAWYSLETALRLQIFPTTTQICATRLGFQSFIYYRALRC